MEVWCNQNIRFVLLSIGVPDARMHALLDRHRRLVDALDIAVPDLETVEVDAIRDLASRHPLWVSKITTSSSNQDPGKLFAHTVSCGALPDETGAAASFLDRLPDHSDVRVVIQVPWGDDPAAILADWPLPADKLVLNVRLAASNPAAPNFDDAAICRLLVRLDELVRSSPLLAVALDTFQDFDRGYHPRLGLVDGRSNIHHWLCDASGPGDG